jgi:phosphoserine phosphatase
MIKVVLFDCDSTLSAVEGIDLLARRAGMEAAIAPLTRAAMDGQLPLEKVYRQRLAQIRPGRGDVDWLGGQYIAGGVTGAAEVVAVLQRSGRQVHIVSGGLKPAVLYLARHLGIPAAQVHAVDLVFDAAGGYLGYDETSPLARGGGKAEICRRLGLKPGEAVLVGDGVTDLEAAEAGVTVIGFGGVARREAMARRASVYVEGPSLLPVLDVILTPLERGNAGIGE